MPATAAPDTPQNCEFCRYSLPVPDAKRICRRYPPTPIYDPQKASTDQYVDAIWPLVDGSWWCAEWKTENL